MPDNVSIGLRTQPHFPLHPYSLLPWLLINVLPVISQACVHLGQTCLVPSNVVPNSLTPRQLTTFAKKSLLLNLCILVIDHHCTPCLHFPSLKFSTKLQKMSLSFPHPQCLIGIKILAYQTSVGPSRHWVGFVHDDEDIVSIWEGEGWTGLGSSSFRLGPLPSFWVLQFLVLSHCFSAHHTLCIFCYSFYIVSLFFLSFSLSFLFMRQWGRRHFGGGYMW